MKYKKCKQFSKTTRGTKYNGKRHKVIFHYTFNIFNKPIGALNKTVQVDAIFKKYNKQLLEQNSHN